MARAFKRRRRREQLVRTIFVGMASLGPPAITILRCGLVVVLVWSGGLKFAKYEADRFIPLIANSPAMSFVYTQGTCLPRLPPSIFGVEGSPLRRVLPAAATSP